ncbi:MAG: hypothetical protein AMS26_13720 [Bacteroides sp. SM23_62]|nr:MAG: hypothetical protein AMS26_13720 [Bacteroides sp. SM23_62]
MPENADRPLSFFQELKRRKVVRVIIVYAAASFVILELASIIQEPFGLPEWTIRLVFIILLIGLIISIILSWIYDIAPEGGIVKTEPAHESIEKIPEKPSTVNAWKIATYISAVVIAGFVLYHIFGTNNKINLSGLERTIAILPFESLGQDKMTGSMVDALPIALIMELQNVEDFIIRPRESTLKYKGTDLRSPDIGKDLNVNFLLKGYLQQQRNSILADIMFINAASEEVIWNHSYEMALDNIFQVQQEISRQVANSLATNFTPRDKKPTDNPDAWLAYLNGLNYYWQDESKQDFLLAIKYFEKAIKLDPNFLHAYAKLAASNSWMYHFYFDRSQERLQQANKDIEKINEIDPGNPEGIFTRGIYYYITHDYDKALKQYKMAEGLVNDEVEYFVCLAALYRRKSNLEDANRYFLKAFEQDPQNRIVISEIAETYLLMREYDLAEKFFNQSILMGAARADKLINNVYMYLGWEEGTERSKQALKLLKNHPDNESNPSLLHQQIWIDLIDRRYQDALISASEENFDTVSHQFIYRPRSIYIAEVHRLQNNDPMTYLYYDSARIHLEAKINASPQDSRYHSALGIAYAGLGKKPEAIKEGKLAVSLMPVEKDFYRGIFMLEDLARIYTMVGEYEIALDYLDQLLSMPSFMSVNLLKKDPVWEPLWELPEFNQLIEKYS